MGDKKPNALVVYPSGLPLNLVVFDPAGILQSFCSWLRNPGGTGVSKSFKRYAACLFHCGGCLVAFAAVEDCLSPVLSMASAYNKCGWN